MKIGNTTFNVEAIAEIGKEKFAEIHAHWGEKRIENIWNTLFPDSEAKELNSKQKQGVRSQRINKEDIFTSDEHKEILNDANSVRPTSERHKKRSDA